GLDEHDPALVGGKRIVLHALRDDMEVALMQDHVRAVPVTDRQTAAMNEEELVLVSVRVPDELALDLGDFHVLAVRRRDDARRPVLRKLAEGRVEIGLAHCLTHRSPHAGSSTSVHSSDGSGSGSFWANSAAALTIARISPSI